jgi:hypothetical protein
MSEFWQGFIFGAATLAFVLVLWRFIWDRWIDAP